MGRPRKKYWLTEDQQKLVEKNYNLIYKYAQDYDLDLTSSAMEDWYGVLVTGLCKAANVFDPRRGKFSTLAYKCMTTEVYCAKRAYRLHNPVLECSLNEYRENFDEDINTTVKLPVNYSGEDFASTIDLRLLLEEEYKKMGKYSNICKCALEYGVPISELTPSLKVSKQAGYLQYNKFLSNLKRRLEENKQERSV